MLCPVLIDTTVTPLETLKKYWGYSSFRPMQESIIKSVLDGKDTLALMPTGGGKSITFQVPALMVHGICVVITPLVALMKDQVDRLVHMNIKAAYVHSGMKSAKIEEVLDNCLYGDYKFLYVSPERLLSERFLRKIQLMRVSFIVVDESHCVCQWGYDFRPSYLKISDFRSLLPEIPLLALTATATQEVVHDIMDKLSFHKESSNYFRRSFYRKNLSYIVRYCRDKAGEVVNLLQRIEGSGLIYVRSRKKTKLYADLLNSFDISADYFHAGLSPKSKMKKQREWMNGNIRIMVCTNAFGMGIDKEDVRIVIHPDLPTAPEDYYQEAGRAARDNKLSYAILLYDPVLDSQNLRKRVKNAFPSRKVIQDIYGHIGSFLQVAEGAGEGFLFELDLFAFCKNFKYSMIDLKAALVLLDIAGYIDFEENKSLPSRLKFTISRNELYGVMNAAPVLYDKIVELLLRSYTGLFTEYAFIEEQVICDKLEIEPSLFYAVMLQLNRWRVLDYIPGKRSTYIRYKTARLPKHKVIIPYESYEKRLNKELDRVNSILSYVDTRETCRSQMLLNYFGEKRSFKCGLCDVCRRQKPGKFTFRIMEIILVYLRDARFPLKIDKIASDMSLPKSYIRDTIEFVSKEGQPYRLDEDTIYKLL